MLRIIRNWLGFSAFSGSGDYWSSRYRNGGDSGGGSAGEFAAFKANVVNGLVSEYGARSMFELGCGDGRQASLLDVDSYMGMDIAPEAVSLCRQRLADRSSFRFQCYEPHVFDPGKHISDIAISMDVIYHLVETDVYETYIRHLFAVANRLVVIYSTNANIGSFFSGRHVRHRRFVDDVPRLAPGWDLVRQVNNPFPVRFLAYGAVIANFYIFARASNISAA